jgi:hypothetical protein
MRPKAEIKDRHREVLAVSQRHRLAKSMANVDDDRASAYQSRLQIHRQQQIVFDNESCDAA